MSACCDNCHSILQDDAQKSKTEFPSKIKKSRKLNFHDSSQLVDHLNNPKNQLMMGLQPDIVNGNSMANMMGNEIQPQNGLIIRPTFNNGLAAFQPINMEDQERYKQERKRQRNREAATKCRQKKMEKMRQLELNAELLNREVEKLVKVASDSRMQVDELKLQVMNHINNGCIIYMKIVNEGNLDNQFVDIADERSQLNQQNQEITNLSNQIQCSNNTQQQVNEENHLYEHYYYTNYPMVNDQMQSGHFHTNYQSENQITQHYANNQLTQSTLINKNVFYSDQVN